MKLFILLESNWVLVGWMLLILIGCIGAFLLLAVIENATGIRFVNKAGKGVISNYNAADEYLKNKNADEHSLESLREIKKQLDKKASLLKFDILKEPTPEEIQNKENLKKGLSDIGKNYKPKP